MRLLFFIGADVGKGLMNKIKQQRMEVVSLELGKTHAGYKVQKEGSPNNGVIFCSMFSTELGNSQKWLVRSHP